MHRPLPQLDLPRVSLGGLAVGSLHGAWLSIHNKIGGPWTLA